MVMALSTGTSERVSVVILLSSQKQKSDDRRQRLAIGQFNRTNSHY